MRAHIVDHPSRPPEVNPLEAWPWPTQAYLQVPVPEGYEDAGLRVPEPGEWYLSRISGRPAVASSDAGNRPYTVRRILRKVAPKADWPSPEYDALPTPAGFVRTGEFVDPRGYRGGGTHYLEECGWASPISEPRGYVGDPRRYILRRVRRWMLTETGETRYPRDYEFYLSADHKPFQWRQQVPGKTERTILALTEVTGELI